MALGSTPSLPPVKLPIKPVMLTAATLYRSRLESYLGLAFKGILWSLPLGLLCLSLMALMLANTLSRMPTNAISPQLMPIIATLAPVAGWLSLLLIPISIFCFTKSLVCTGTIARLAYQDLAGQPESVQEAERTVVSRQWSLLRVASQVAVYLLLVYLGFVIVGMMVGMIVGGIAIAGLRLPPEVTLVLVYCVVIAIIVLGCVWFYACWFTAEMPLVVSDTVTGQESLVRNADLVRSAHSQLFRLVFWTGLLASGLAWAVNTFGELVVAATPAGSPLFGLMVLLSLGMSLAASLAIAPFWQAVKAVAYYRLSHATGQSGSPIS